MIELVGKDQPNYSDLARELSAIGTAGVLAINYYNGKWFVQLSTHEFLGMFGTYLVSEFVGHDGRPAFLAEAKAYGITFQAIVPDQRELA